MRASGNGNLTCPECMCIASNIIHHQPIRLDDGFLYLRNISQKVLGKSEGHFCSICHEDFKLRDTELGTMDTTKPWCDHIFCFHCLSKCKHQRITEMNYSNAQIAGQLQRRPSIEVEVIDEPTGCCDWAMDTTSSTGIGIWHEERCICPLVHKKLRNCHHEGCNKRVHRCCQEDWLDHHCYPWTREDPCFCWEHNEHYIRWVRFKGGEIPCLENGCVEGLFLGARTLVRTTVILFM